MKHRNSHFVVGYWGRLRRGRPVPDQTDIDPKALRRVLPIIFLLDARPDGRCIYRLAGTGICERYGSELRGLNFLSQWDADSRTRLVHLLQQALAARAPLCLTSVGATQDCRMVEIETVLMPISASSGNEPKHFLGMAQVLGEPGALAGRVVSFERLVTSSIVREDAPESGVLVAEAPTLESRAHSPHLRLVVSR